MSNDVSNEVNGDVMLNEYVMTTNQLIGSVKKYNKKLFDQVKLSYSELYDEKDTKVWTNTRFWLIWTTLRSTRL